MEGVVSILSRLRPAVERVVPRAARVYRAVRDELAASKRPLKMMPEQFLLAGTPDMTAGRFEPDERRIIRRQLLHADFFVDVGANVGYYTCMARSANKRTIAFEPFPHNLQNLFRAIDANGWTDVEVWPVAVGDTQSVLRLYGAQTGASLVRGWAANSDQHWLFVPVTTLDLLLADRFEGQRGLIKIDIEGAEYRALLGATSLLKKAPQPAWLVEISLTKHHPETNRHYLDTFDLFFNHGYRAVTADEEERSVTRDDVVQWVRDGREPSAYNWLFLPQS